MGFKLWIEDTNNGEEGHNIYRSTSPMDPQNLPAPYDTVGVDLAEWEDGAVTPGQTYYYRVGAFTAGGTFEQVSDEIELEAVQPTYPVVGLVTHYEMDVVENGELTDLAGNANGTLFGTTLVTDPVVGPARELLNPSSTASDYIAAQTGEALGQVNVTVAVWFKTSNTSDVMFLFAQRVSDLRSRGIALSSAGIFATSRNASQSSSNNGYEQTTPVTGYQDDNWHLAVYQQEGAVLRLYLDGSSFLVEHTMPSVDEGPMSDEILFGAQKASASTGPVNPSSGLKGRIASCRTYDRILTPSEIDQLYTQHGGAL